MKKTIFVILAVILIMVSFFYFETPYYLLRPVFHKQIINKYAKDYKLDPILIIAIIKVESNFFRRAKSQRGAIGLMQLLPSTAKELSNEIGFKDFKAEDLENPEVNIHLGMFYVRKLLDEFDNNEILALSAYNAGVSNVETWYMKNPILGLEVSDIPFEETRNYVNNVQRTYQWLKTIQGLKNLIHKQKA
jgi:soluble lytic murein transglycosylase